MYMADKALSYDVVVVGKGWNGKGEVDSRVWLGRKFHVPRIVWDTNRSDVEAHTEMAVGNKWVVNQCRTVGV